MPSSYQSSTALELCAQLEALEALGIDRVYLDVWNNGKVYFDSPTMAASVPSAVGDDRLSWAAPDACPGFKGEIHAWFEYGLMATYGDSTATPFAAWTKKQGWLLPGISGGWTWMNATQDAAVDFLG